MKYALITGPSGFDVVDFLRTGYHLTLAQYADQPLYASFYRDLADKGHFIMVDNGAAELGSSIPFKHVLEFAGRIKADEIVMPDHLDNADKTLAATSKVLYQVPQRSRAVVPQGTTWEEWEYCAKRLVLLGCTTICIAKRYEKLPGGRAYALQILKYMGVLETHNVHLLGFYNNPVAEIASAQREYFRVRGVDSAAPIAYAQKHLPIVGEERASYAWDEPFDQSLALSNARTIIATCRKDF